MPRKKVKKTRVKAIRKTKIVTQPVKRFSFPSFKWGESYTSLLMGVVAVIIAALFIGSLLRQQHQPLQQTSSVSTSPTTAVKTVTPSQEQPSEFKNATKTYIVQQGDDLWHIAEKFYKSGYNWVDIAAVNKLDNPGLLFTGQQLTIPTVTAKVATITTAMQHAPPTNAITGNSYTIVHGDSLWDISVRAYGDGYRWVDIAKANSLANPGLIFSGNVLIIPR